MPDQDPEEITDTERARRRASRAAGRDMRDAIAFGTDDERHGAIGAFMQAISQYDPLNLDRLHVPDDAGEYERALREILTRIPDGWGRWISCDRGWFPIVVGIHEQLVAIDPDYVVHQVKEKFGRLCYYFRTSDTVDQHTKALMNELVADAESRCATICEACGAQGAVLCVGALSWHKTVCPTCAAADGYEPLGETIEELTQDRWRGVWSLAIASGGSQVWNLNYGEITWDDGELYRSAEVLVPPRVNQAARILRSDGTERASGLITEIRRIH